MTRPPYKYHTTDLYSAHLPAGFRYKLQGRTEVGDRNGGDPARRPF